MSSHLAGRSAINQLWHGRIEQGTRQANHTFGFCGFLLLANLQVLSGILVIRINSNTFAVVLDGLHSFTELFVCDTSVVERTRTLTTRTSTWHLSEGLHSQHPQGLVLIHLDNLGEICDSKLGVAASVEVSNPTVVVCVLVGWVEADRFSVLYHSQRVLLIKQELVALAIVFQRSLDVGG